MTVASSLSKVSYSGNGTTSTFAVPFRFVAEADLVLVLRDADGAETTLTLGTDYAVTGVGDDIGGAVSLTAPPAAGETLTVLRDPELVQEVDYQENDPFPAETHEAALDRLTMMAQANRERIGRSLLLPVSSSTSGLTVPEPESGRVLAWNAAGDGLENGPATDGMAAAAENAAAAQDAQAGAEAAQTSAETARDAAQAAQSAAEAARDEAAAIVDGRAENITYDPAGSSLAATDVQAALDELAGEKAEAADLNMVRNGLLAEAIRRAVGDGVDGREYLGDGWIDPLADAGDVDAANSTGWDHETADGGYLRPTPGSDSAALELSTLTHEDVKGGITTLTVDVENASGHFDTAAGAKAQAGCRVVTADGEVVITAITGDGTGTDAVAFSGTLAAGAHSVAGIHGTEYAEGVLRLSRYSAGYTEDRCTGGTASASTVLSASYAAAYACDDNTSTKWACDDNQGAGAWWAYLFPSALSIRRIPVSAEPQNYAGVWRVDYSDDGGVTWTPAQTFTGLSYAATLDLDEYGEHLAWRVYSPNAGLGGGGIQLGTTTVTIKEISMLELDQTRPVDTFYIATGTIDAASIASITSAAITGDDAGQTVLFALSLDGGSTWLGDSFSAVTSITAPDSTWLTAAEFEALTSYPSLTGDIGIKIALKTTAASGDPNVSAVDLTVVGQVADMDLRFAAFTAAAPDLARVALVLEAVDDITLDTDLTAQVRRGTGDWVAADLGVDSAYDAAAVLVVGDADLSAGSGADTVLRLASSGNKDFKIRAASCTFKGVA